MENKLRLCVYVLGFTALFFFFCQALPAAGNRASISGRYSAPISGSALGRCFFLSKQPLFEMLSCWNGSSYYPAKALMSWRESSFYPCSSQQWVLRALEKSTASQQSWWERAKRFPFHLNFHFSSAYLEGTNLAVLPPFKTEKFPTWHSYWYIKS